jgi:hypothetical protein
MSFPVSSCVRSDCARIECWAGPGWRSVCRALRPPIRPGATVQAPRASMTCIPLFDEHRCRAGSLERSASGTQGGQLLNRFRTHPLPFSMHMGGKKCVTIVLLPNSKELFFPRHCSPRPHNQNALPRCAQLRIRPAYILRKEMDQQAWNCLLNGEEYTTERDTLPLDRAEDYSTGLLGHDLKEFDLEY